SLCAEWNSERASARVVDKAEKTYSHVHVTGSKAHVNIDVSENHYKIMLDVSHRLLLRLGNEKVIFELLTNIMQFLGRYFTELYQHTIGIRELNIGGSSL